MTAPIDLPEVLRVHGDRVDPVALLNLYLEQVTRDLARIKAAIEAADFHEVREGAHSIKSCSSNLFATEMKELSKELEMLMVGGQHAEAEAMYRKIDAEFGRIRAFAAEYLRKVRAP